MKIDSLPPWISLREVEGGYCLSFKGRRLTAAVQPRGAAEKRASRLTTPSNTIVLLSSPLFGYGVDALLEKLPHNSLILCAEADEELRSLALAMMPRKLWEDPRVHPRIIGSERELREELEKINLGFYRRVTTLSLSGGYGLHPHVYRGMETLIQGTLREFWRNRATMTVMGRLWMENIVSNLGLLERGETLSRFATDKPIVLTGAGESLEHSLDFLKEHRKKFTLMAADTAIPILLESGLVPDLAVVVEAQHANLGDFLSPGALDIPCLFDLTSYPGLIRRHRGPKGFFLSRFDSVALWESMKEWNILPPVIPPLGSVGIAALYLALFLTRGNILFTGLDFSFEPGKTHSRGAPSHRRRLAEMNRFNPLLRLDHGLSPPLSLHKNRLGRRVLSSPNLLGYHDLLGYFKESNRVWDAGNRSLPSCLPWTENPAELLSCPPEQRMKSLDVPDTNALRGFQEALREDLARLGELGYRWLKGDRQGSTEKILEELMEKCDFLHIYFPDAPKMERIEEGYLKRVLLSGARCLELLQRGE